MGLLWVDASKKKYVTDEKHDELVNELIGDRADRKEEALARLGIDEEQVQEIPPVFFEGYASGAPTKNGRQYFAFHSGQNIFVTPTKQLTCLLYTSPSPRDYAASRMPSSA